ncbi:MAG TPA: YicC/YloC family endoribonuclease [Gemmatimonadota bacterium]|nr:YicC/YloC family endoribonuclease [Gemmatimonadota bacterium]
MIRSMTGFGRGEAVSSGYRFAAEIKSVNHRFLNINVRMPRAFAHLESRFTALCSSRCERGHLNVSIELERAGEDGASGPRLNRQVLDRYLEIVSDLADLGADGRGISAGSLLALPGVIVWEAEEIAMPDEAFVEGAAGALGIALDALVESRATEGRALLADFQARLDAIESSRRRIEELSPLREERERERLREKVRGLIEDPADELERRIEQEIVLLADRVDVSEELTRMRAHLDHFAAELEGDGGSIGRKLTFLLQELGREANTMGSKASDPEIQKAAIEIKSELEKMREQAENVE